MANSRSVVAAALAVYVTRVDGYTLDSVMRKDYIMANWPQPGKEYFGASHVGRWTYAPENKFPRRNLADIPGFSDMPQPDPLGVNRPPQPLSVNATPPFRMANVTGNCTIPRSAGFDGYNATSNQYGAHVWLANLLYNEFIAWPFDLWITATRSVPDPTNSSLMVFPFRIPLFDHVLNKDSPLHWAPWAAGSAGILHQQYVGMPYTPDFPWLQQASESYVSSSPYVHSWASFGAGEWTVFCNAWVTDPVSGELRVSQYKALDDMEVDLQQARASAQGRYTPSLDGIDGPGRSRWDEGYAGSWLTGGNGAQLVPGNPNAITGKWGKYINISSQYNYKQECCWRTYTGPGAVMRDIRLRDRTNMTYDDCCWFGLPAHTNDPYFPDSNQPATDASKFMPFPSYTDRAIDFGYWGYRRTLDTQQPYGPYGPKYNLYVRHNVRSPIVEDVYPEIWFFYGDQAGRDSQLAARTYDLVAWNKPLEPTYLAGGIQQTQYAAYGVDRNNTPTCYTTPYIDPNTNNTVMDCAPQLATDSFNTLNKRGLFNTRSYDWYDAEWGLEYMHGEDTAPPGNWSEMAHDYRNVGPDLEAFTSASGGCTFLCRKTFRIYTHGWNTFYKLDPLLPNGLTNQYKQPVRLSATDVPTGVRNTFMVRLTSQPANQSWFQYALGAPRRAWPCPTLSNWANGRVGNGSTVWSHLHFSFPKLTHTAPSKTTSPMYDEASAVAGKSFRGWSKATPAMDAYVDSPYTFNMSEIKALNMFADASGETAYDDLSFTFDVASVYAVDTAAIPGWRDFGSDIGEDEALHGGASFRPWDYDVRSWLPSMKNGALDLPEGYLNPVVFKAQAVPGGWDTAQFTFTPETNRKLYIINISIWDTGFTAPMLAAKGYDRYDKSLLDGPYNLTIQYFVLAQACPQCQAGSYQVAGCRGRGQASTCAPCSGACANGEYVSRPCGPAAVGGGDRTCAACRTTCPAGFRLDKKCNGTDTDQAQCLVCSACPAGQYAAGGCNGTIGGITDTICKACPDLTTTPASATLYFPAGCPVSLTGKVIADTIKRDPTSNLSTGGGSVQYRTCSTCAAGVQYALQACSAGYDTVCADCSPACGAGQYESQACTAEHDRACSACRASCPTGTYRAAACTPTADTRCSTCTSTCPAGSYASINCTATADTVCATCNCSSIGASGCDAVTGTCQCKAGFTGPRCDTCVAGVFGPTCSDTCACTGAGAVSNTCAARDGRCTCRTGFTGFYCDRCDAGKYGPTCSSTCACGPHGQCNDDVAGDGFCTCSAGWGGTDCRAVLGSNLQIFTGSPLSDLTAKEGQAVSYAIPSTSFVLSTASNDTITRMGLSSSMASLNLTGGPAWLQLVTTSVGSGFALQGTPSRSDVTVTASSSSPLEAVLTCYTNGGSAIAYLRVSVAHTNRAPTFLRAIQPSTFRVGARWTLSLAMGTDINDDDVTPFGDTLSVLYSGQADWMTVQSPRYEGGRLVYNMSGTPPSTAAGQSYTITVTLQDGSGATATTTATVTIPSSTTAAVLSFVGLAAVHVAQDSMLNFVVPDSVWSVAAGQPGSEIISFDAGSVSPVVTAPARQRMLHVIGERVAHTMPKTTARRLAAAVPAAAHATGGMHAMAAAFLQEHSEASEAAARVVADRKAARQAARRLAIKSPQTLARSLSISVQDAENVARMDEREANQQETKDTHWDYYSTLPKPHVVQAAAEKRVLTVLGACSWLGVARSADHVPRPLLWGKPGSADVGSVCEVTVTATNAAGYSVTGRVSVVVDDANDPPVARLSLRPLTKPAGTSFSVKWDMGSLFSDEDAPGTGMGRDVLTFAIGELGSTTASGVPTPPQSFLLFTCVSGGVPGYISDVCTLRGNASADQQGSYGLELVAKDAAGAVATLPLLLKISPPIQVALRTSPWSTCSRGCGGGTMFRTHTCIDYKGQAVDDENCQNLLDVVSSTKTSLETEACNTQDCSTAHWTIGAWGQCSAACAVAVPDSSPTTYNLPTTTRIVACTSGTGLDVLPDSQCPSPKPDSGKVCNTQACVAAGSNSSTASSSTTSSTSCKGIVDPAEVCCDATAPSGYCCLGPSGSASVDECGVCDGMNMCDMVRTVMLASSGLAARVCPGGYPLSNTSLLTAQQEQVAASIEQALGVPAGSVTVTQFACPTTSNARRMLSIPQAKRFLSTGPTSVSLSFTLGSSAGLSSVEVGQALTDRLPASMASSLGLTAQVMGGETSRVPTCGNGICETGECTGDSCSYPCAADCGDYAMTCPLSATGLPCASNGACRLADSTCRCFKGYTGSTCEACAEGYSPKKTASGGKVCVSVHDAASSMGLLSLEEPLTFEKSAGFGSMVTIIAGAVLAVVVWAYMYRKVFKARADAKSAKDGAAYHGTAKDKAGHGSTSMTSASASHGGPDGEAAHGGDLTFTNKMFHKGPGQAQGQASEEEHEDNKMDLNKTITNPLQASLAQYRQGGALAAGSGHGHVKGHGAAHGATTTSTHHSSRRSSDEAGSPSADGDMSPSAIGALLSGPVMIRVSTASRSDMGSRTGEGSPTAMHGQPSADGAAGASDNGTNMRAYSGRDFEQRAFRHGLPTDEEGRADIGVGPTRARKSQGGPAVVPNPLRGVARRNSGGAENTGVEGETSQHSGRQAYDHTAGPRSRAEAKAADVALGPDPTGLAHGITATDSFRVVTGPTQAGRRAHGAALGLAQPAAGAELASALASMATTTDGDFMKEQ